MIAARGRWGSGLLAATLLLGAGCAGSRAIDGSLDAAEVAAINRELRGKTIRVTDVGGGAELWRRAELTADTLLGADCATGRSRAARLVALRSISFRSAEAGARAAARWGFRAGTAGGLAWGIAAWNQDRLVTWSTENSAGGHPSTRRRLLRTAAAAAVLGGAGGLAGIPIGALAGAEVRLEIRAEP